MLTSLLPWLCAALLAFAQPPSPPTPPAPAAFPDPIVYGDSSVYRQLRSALDLRAAAMAPEKCYLHTDRTLLAPGDTLWWSAYVRNAGDLLPSTQSQILYVELLDPRGSVLQQRTVLALGGTAVGEFDLDGNLPGGLYKIRARTAWMRNTDQAFERDITLQKTVLPRLNLRLEWERKAVGPGEVAIARFDAHSLSSQPLAQRNFRYTAAAAGQQFLEKTATTDAAGRAYIRFEMPKKLDSPDGLLNIMIEHEGQTEAISRPIPIVLNRIDLQFFPEGGDAVAGLPCRMGFKALNEHGKPADVSGIVADSRGQKVASFSSWHDGMGAFDFQPQPGERYTAYLEEPAAAARAYDMPDARSQGFALRLREHTPGSLGFELNATRPGKVYLVATSRDKVFYFNEIMLQDSPMASGSKTSGSITRTLSIPTHDLPIGIARFTLLDEKKTEVAERLVFLHRDRGLRFDIQTDKPRYLPRETVRMRIRATDHAGRPVQGQFSMGITDEPLLNYADDKQGHLLSALLLEQDLSGPVEEPNFYFDLKEPKAQQALDYLLLTQGWRRFAWKEVLNPAPLAYTNQPERATVAGRLCHPQTGLPLAGHTLRLNPDGASVKTDSAGRFVFADVDLLSHRHIRDQQEKLHEIVDFSQNMSLREGFAEGRQEWYYTSASTHPQGSTVLVGKVNEASVQEELIGATIKVMQGKNLVRGGITDYKGDYSMLLAPGIYDLEISYTGFTPTRISGVRVQQGRINVCNAEMSAGTVLEEVTVRSYKVPLIQQDQTSSGQTISATMGGMGIRDANGRVARAMDDMPGRPRKEAKRAKAEEKPAPLTSEQIRQMPTRTVQAIQAAPAGATAADDGQARVRGSRSKATQYYIDGVRVAGAPSEAAAQKDVRMGNTEAELASRDDLTMDEVVVLGRTQQDIARETGAISTIRFDAPNARNRRRDKEGADMMKAARAPQPSSPSRPPVRQYVRARQFYVPKYSGPVSQRTDFRPTIYWNPDLRTDAEGRATVEFVASDAITNFRATLEGISASGLPGHAEQQFFVEKPISVSTKVPPSVIAGDTLRLQVLLSNKTGQTVSGQFSVEKPACLTPILAAGQKEESLRIAPQQSLTLTLAYLVQPSPNPDPQPLRIAFRSPEAFEDVLETQVRVLDRGFPARHVLTANKAQNQFDLRLMEPVEGTLRAVLTAYPSPLEDVLKGMERMLRQPSGCFEQVSSSNYPNLLVLDLLRSTGNSRPEVESRARALLEDGYKRLTAYECKSGGFDWWGRDPGHEGLTAYGLLEFTDMGRVFEVDKKMLDRSAQWMLSRRDGKGGWKRAADQHGWQSDGVVDAYIAWALAEAGYGKQFEREIEHACTTATQSGDPYQVALLANAMASLKDARATGLMAQLLEKQGADGSWAGASHSVMYAHGDCFRIETTALAALALMKTGRHEGAVSKALEFILSRKNEYGYGSTQSTVLSLRALVEFAKASSQKPSDGQIVVQVDGRRVAEQAFSPQQPKRIEMAGLEQFINRPDARVEVFFEGKNGRPAAVIPFDLEIKYASRLPRNKSGCLLALSTSLAKTTAQVGETVRLSTVLRNTTDGPLASPMVVLGIPAGLTLQPWQLKKLMEEKRCDFYELWDGYAVFHFERLAAGESRTLDLDLRADVPGSFESPASQAFLYYQNDERVWSKPERLVVQ